MITDFKNCTGCRACEQQCSRNAIAMRADFEGFLYPKIDTEKCNNCGLCEKTCPMLRDDLQNSVLETIAAKNLNKEQILRSASGGVFAAIAEVILEQGGVVFGCAFDENIVAGHIFAENLNELCKLQGSKYVQSDTKNTYSQAKEFLRQNRKVLYSGTPCQVAGLKAFLGKDYENLITIDLICHGVPSPKLFAKYIEWLGKKMGGRIIYYDFRNKEQGGWRYGLKAETEIKSEYLKTSLDPYLLSFSKKETLRECCYSCKYKCETRTGDLTIGDYWGIFSKKVHPDFFSRDGVSVILVNTHNGRKIFENIKNKVESIQSTFKNVTSTQANFKPSSIERPMIRDYIYNMDESFFKISLYRKLKSLVPDKIKKYLWEIRNALESLMITYLGKFKNRGEPK